MREGQEVIIRRGRTKDRATSSMVGGDLAGTRAVVVGTPEMRESPHTGRLEERVCVMPTNVDTRGWLDLPVRDVRRSGLAGAADLVTEKARGILGRRLQRGTSRAEFETRGGRRVLVTRSCDLEGVVSERVEALEG